MRDCHGEGRFQVEKSDLIKSLSITANCVKKLKIPLGLFFCQHKYAFVQTQDIHIRKLRIPYVVFLEIM